MNFKHTIYSNDPCDYDLDDMRKELASETDREANDITDAETWDFIYRDINANYDAEKCNLDRSLTGRIICIASLGLWNGRRTGYVIRGCNLTEILHGDSDNQTYTVGSNGHNIVAEGIHHDGTNYYTFREIREDRNIDTLLCKLYDGTATVSDISRYTKSLLPYVNDIYGWGRKITPPPTPVETRVAA